MASLHRRSAQATVPTASRASYLGGSPGFWGETTLRVDADRDRGPSNLLGVLLDAYWRSLADDPLSALLFTAFVSLAGVLLVLLWHIAVYLLGL